MGRLSRIPLSRPQDEAFEKGPILLKFKSKIADLERVILMP